MKIEVENLSGHFKKIKIEVPVEKVSGHIQAYYKNLQKEVTLKGFRKGKAPIAMVKEAYSDSAQNKIMREIVESNLSEALREHSFMPINVPQIDVEKLHETTPFVFTATFENTPPIDLKEYTGYKASKASVEVTPADIEKTLDSIRTQLAKYEPAVIETPLAIGQFAQLDYEATNLAGDVVPEASEKDSFVEIGSGALFPDFEKQILGMKAGETRSFSVSYPEAKTDEERTPVSGKTLSYATSVKEIRQRTLPEWTDETAKSVGPFESLEDLKKRVEEDLKQHKDQQNKKDLQEQLVNWLIEKNPVDAPETMMNSQMEQLAVDAGMQLSKMGLDEKTIEERLKSWGGEMQERAARQVKASMLLSAISRKEKIQASDEDIRQEILRMAQSNGQSPKQVWEELQKRGLVNGLVRQVTELKALDWVTERVHLE